MPKSQKKKSRFSSIENTKRLEIARLHQEGKSAREISEILKVSRPTVYQWRNCKAKKGNKNADNTFRNKRLSLSPEEELQVVKRAHENKASHGGHLNVTSLAQSLNLSYGVVRRILSVHKIPLKTDKTKVTSKPNPASLQMRSPPTQREVSQACGYSQSTVSRALKNDRRIQSDVRKAIQDTATQLGYRLNPHLTSLSERRWKSQERYLKLAYITELDDGSFAWPMDKAFYPILHTESETRGYTLELHDILDYSNTTRLTQVLYHRGVQGVIFGLGLKKEITTKQFAENNWSDFSLVGCGNLNVRYLNSVSFQQTEEGLRAAFEQAIKYKYHRIGYLYLPSQSSIQLHPYPNSPEIVNLTEKLQASFLSPHDRIPSLLLEEIDEHYELNSLRDYLDFYQPDSLICNCDRGFTLLRKLGNEKHKRKQIGFISLDKNKSKNDRIAGLVLSDWTDYAKRLITVLSEQIHHNEFGLPAAPRSRGVTYKKWYSGKSLPRKVLKKSKLQYYIHDSTGEKNLKSEAEHFHFLDISTVVNRSRMIPGQWFGKQTLALPPGVINNGRTHFQPIDSNQSKQNDVLIMRSQIHADSEQKSIFPKRIKIALGAKIKACHFLHTGGYIAPLKPFASYSLTYADKTEEALPLAGLSRLHNDKCTPAKWKYGNAPNTCESSAPLAYKHAPTANIGDWFANYNIPPSSQMGQNAKALVISNSSDSYYCYLYSLSWRNPFPEKEVVSLDICSFANTPSTLAVLGITVEWI